VRFGLHRSACMAVREGKSLMVSKHQRQEGKN
jgi:hypothetical protein